MIFHDKIISLGGIKMAFDGIVTHSIVSELKNVIGYKIDKVYEPDKNTIIFGLYGRQKIWLFFLVYLQIIIDFI